MEVSVDGKVPQGVDQSSPTEPDLCYATIQSLDSRNAKTRGLPPEAIDTDPAELGRNLRDPNTPFERQLELLGRYSRERFELEPPGTPISSTRLNGEAEALGLQYILFAHTYRVDTRTPNEIVQTGFVPRSDKPAGTLLEHLEHKSGNMVSTTAKEGNVECFGGLAVHRKLAPIGEDTVEALNREIRAQFDSDLAELQRLLPNPSPWQFDTIVATMTPGNVQRSLSRLRELESILPPELRSSSTPIEHVNWESGLENAYIRHSLVNPDLYSVEQRYRAFEYRIDDVFGVYIDCDSPGFLFKEQYEITIASAKPEQIRAAREVVVTAPYSGWRRDEGLTLDHRQVKLTPGAWRELNTPATESEVAVDG